MTIFDTIKEYDEDMMAEFLYRFARDTINLSKEAVMKFLEQEVPEIEEK